MNNHIFHLAIPCKCLLETKAFYCDKLQIPHGRMYDDRISLNFFGAQIVTHLCPDKIDDIVEIYPRHFGLTFTTESAFDEFHQRAIDADVTFFKPLFTRFDGLKEKHKTFFIIDPANNLLEFKYYFDQSQNY